MEIKLLGRKSLCMSVAVSDWVLELRSGDIACSWALS